MSLQKTEIETTSDFQEAFTGHQDVPIYLGHLNDIAYFRDDVKKKGSLSKYFHNVFCPERTGGYTFEKNSAFMQGGMKAGRSFLLISDLHHYEEAISNRIAQIKSTTWKKFTKNDVYHKSNARQNDIVNLGVAYDEIRMLYDNGYRFERSEKNPSNTLAVAPKKIASELIIKDYQGLTGKDCDDDVLQELLTIQEMLQDIALQRSQSQKLHQTPRLQPKFNDNSSKMDTAEILSLLSISEKSIDDLKSSIKSDSTNDNSKLPNFNPDSNKKVMRSISNDSVPSFYSSSNKYQSPFFSSRSSADTDKNWRRTADTDRDWRRTADSDNNWRRTKDQKNSETTDNSKNSQSRNKQFYK